MDSAVWKYFEKNIKDAKAKCNICNKQLSCKGSTTSSLIRHLETSHKITLKRRGIRIPVICDPIPGPSPKKLKIEPQQSNNLLIKKESIAAILSKLVALDGFSVFALNKSSFIRESFTKRGYSLPKSHSDILNLIYGYYKIIKQKYVETIKIKVNENKKFSITLDKWTNKRQRKYINANIHDSDGECFNLGSIRIKGNISNETIIELINDKLNEFGLSFNDILYCTTDGTTEMVQIGNCLPIYHQLCYNHGIYLAVTDVLYTKLDTDIKTIDEDFSSDSYIENDDDFQNSEDEEEVNTSNLSLHIRSEFKVPLNQIRKIVKLFRSSPVYNNVLQTYVRREHGKEFNLLLDCKTKWNTICLMIERFLTIESSVRKAQVALKLDALLNEEIDLKEIRNLLNVLKPIQLAVEALSNKNSNLLTAEGVFKFLFETLVEQKSFIANEMLSAIKIYITQRRNNNIVSLIKFLQNSQSLKNNLNESNDFFKMTSKQVIIQTATEYATNCKIFSNENNSQIFTQTEIIKEEENDEDILENKILPLPKMLQSRISESLNTMQVTENVINSLEKEINIYENIGVITANLKQLLECLRTIQPISTSSDSVFSLKGYIMPVKTTNLSDKSINAICFLRSYFLKQYNL